MTEQTFCPACGSAISRLETTCPTCRVSLAKPEPRRVAREIGIYVAVFAVVALSLVAMINLRRVWVFAVLMQGVLPFVIFVALALFLRRHWK